MGPTYVVGVRTVQRIAKSGCRVGIVLQQTMSPLGAWQRVEREAGSMPEARWGKKCRHVQVKLPREVEAHPQ